jgi:hypothetical protein
MKTDHIINNIRSVYIVPGGNIGNNGNSDHSDHNGEGLAPPL